MAKILWPTVLLIFHILGPVNDVNSDDKLTQFAETVEKILEKYNIDATTCTQRTICSSVRDAAKNVAQGVGTSSEKILDGITR